MKSIKKIVVMIPAYNEESTIVEVIKDIPRKIENIPVTIIVIDDYSQDATSEKARKAGADFVFRNAKNEGLGITFRNGIEKALGLGADIIVNIDGDNQFNSKEATKVALPVINNEADMVTGSRFLSGSYVQNMPAVKRLGNKLFTKLISRITGKTFTDTQCGFRAYSRDAALQLNLQGKFTYTQEVFIDLAEKGMRIKEVPIEVKYFQTRNSVISGNIKRYGVKSLGIIAKATRDTQPLTFFGVPALIIFLLGLIGGTFSFGYWIIYHLTTPVRTLLQISVFFVIFGVALGILGLLADMLKTIKKQQDEILYKLKKAEFDKVK